MSLDDLRAKLDQSLRSASPLTRELFVDGRMTAEALRDFINDVMSVSVATVCADGRPHASLTLIACSNDGELYVAVNERSVLYRNLRRSAEVAFTVEKGEHGLMAQGRAAPAGLARDLRDSLLPQLDALMKRGRWLPHDWQGAIYRIEVERIFAR